MFQRGVAKTVPPAAKARCQWSLTSALFAEQELPRDIAFSEHIALFVYRIYMYDYVTPVLVIGTLVSTFAVRNVQHESDSSQPNGSDDDRRSIMHFR